jgi:phage recombination protein Bet
MEFVPFGAEDKIKLSLSIVKNLVAVKTKTGKTCTDNEAIKFMMMCQARRLNPFEGDAFLIGYDNKDGGANFSLITAHQAFLKRAEVNDEYDGMKSGIIVERSGEMMDLEGDFYLPGDKVMGGWATVFFKNRKQAMHKRIRMERFKKPFGIWQEDSAGMICKCAEADALRSSFPTMLGGLYLKEEVERTETKLAAPIFGHTKTVEVEVDDTKQLTTAEMLKERILDAKLDEQKVVAFMVELGLIDKTVDLSEIPESELEIVMDQWDDISARIRKGS